MFHLRAAAEPTIAGKHSLRRIRRRRHREQLDLPTHLPFRIEVDPGSVLSAHFYDLADGTMANVRTTLETTRVADSKSRVPRWKPRTWLVALVIGAVTLLGIGLYFVNAHWPYRYRVVKPLLEDVLGSQLTIAHYHRTYFPNPGFVATGLTLRRKTAPDIPPLGSADTLF